MSKSFDESLPAHILFGDVIEPEFKDAMCKVINKYHLPDSKSIAINMETSSWKLLEPGDKVPEDMLAIPPFSQMINAFPNVCFYNVSSIIKAMKILNPQYSKNETVVEKEVIPQQSVRTYKTRKPKAKKKK